MSFNYNKYSLIYKGVQSQKSRSYKEILRVSFCKNRESEVK